MMTTVIAKMASRAVNSPRARAVLEYIDVDGLLDEAALRQVSLFRRNVTESAATPGGSMFRYHFRTTTSFEMKERVAKPKLGSR